jgi:hypothetical protein
VYYRSKTLATWLALALGSLGAHRFYLHGLRDRWAWLHPLPTLLGAVGAMRMQNLGQDDQVAWLLLPLLGLMLSVGMLAAMICGLTPDDKWADRFNPGQALRPTGWGPVLGVILALLLGGAALMGTLAFGGQMFFEHQAQQAQQAKPAAPN